MHAPVTNMGVDVGPAFSAGAQTPGTTYTYGSYNAGPMAGPAGVWTGLQVDVMFSMAGGSDVAALTGITTIEEAVAPVPEPLSMLLLGGGLAVAGVTRVRKRA